MMHCLETYITAALQQPLNPRILALQDLGCPNTTVQDNMTTHQHQAYPSAGLAVPVVSLGPRTPQFQGFLSK